MAVVVVVVVVVMAALARGEKRVRDRRRVPPGTRPESLIPQVTTLRSARGVTWWKARPVDAWRAPAVLPECARHRR